MRKFGTSLLLLLPIVLSACSGSPTSAAVTSTPSPTVAPTTSTATVNIVGAPSGGTGTPIAFPTSVSIGTTVSAASVKPAAEVATFHADVTFPATPSGNWTITWDFGDGKGVTHKSSCPIGLSGNGVDHSVECAAILQRGLNPTYTYDKAGSYTAVITAASCLTPGCVITDSGVRRETKVEVTEAVHVDLPTGLWISTAHRDNNVLSFAVTLSGGSGAPPAIDWNFGDGSGGRGGLTAQHTYCADGTFTVTVTIVGTNISYSTNVDLPPGTINQYSHC
jgi:PKD repeat protein